MIDQEPQITPQYPTNRIELLRDGIHEPFDIVRRAVVTDEGKQQVLLYAIPGFDIGNPDYYIKDRSGSFRHNPEVVMEYAQEFLTYDYSFGTVEGFEYHANEITHTVRIALNDLGPGCHGITGYIRSIPPEEITDVVITQIRSAFNDFLALEGRNRPLIEVELSHEGTRRVEPIFLERLFRNIFNEPDRKKNLSSGNFKKNLLAITLEVKAYRSDHAFYEWYEKHRASRERWTPQVWQEYYDWLDEFGLQRPTRPEIE